MKTANQKKYLDVDPDEYFRDTRMSFGDHIEELRIHLWRAIIGFGIAFIICFMPFIGKPILAFIAKPVEEQLDVYYERELREAKKKLKDDPKFKEMTKPKSVKLVLPPKEAGKLTNDGTKEIALNVTMYPEQFLPSLDYIKLVGRRPRLKTLQIQEAFVVYLKVCMVTGFVVASPWIFFHIWSFVAAGLYPHEKRLVNYYLPFSIGLFIGGVVFCEFIVIPRTVEALLWFNEWLGFEPDLRLTEWLGFAIILPVIFGLTFQTPLVMLFLQRIGIGSIAGYNKVRKYAYFGLAVAAAVLTPTGDPQTMLLMWFPMCLFYEMGIWLCKIMPGQPLLDFGAPEEEEVVEV